MPDLDAAVLGLVHAASLAGEVTLAPGALADLVVCTGDPFAESWRVESTWVGSRRAWPPGAG